MTDLTAKTTAELTTEDSQVERSLNDVYYYRSSMPSICSERRRDLLRRRAAIRAELERRKAYEGGLSSIVIAAGPQALTKDLSEDKFYA